MKRIIFGLSILAGILVLSTIFIMFAENSVSVAIPEVKIESNSKTLISHAPIYIDGNSGFNATNGVSNPLATGTQIDPYIIENWDIDASSATGIEIRNTDKYFIIRNCTIHDGGSNYQGIYFYYNVTNGKIENVTSRNNRYGIHLYKSLNNCITHCHIYNNSRDGICLECYSSSNQITNCTVYNNSWGGVFLYYYSSSNKLRNNSLDGNSDNLRIWGYAVGDYYQDIDMSNKINGKPIYYITEQNNLVFDERIIVGYFGLISCNNISIKNLDIYGILFANTSSSTITNCSLSNSMSVIRLYYSSYNTITNCTIYNNGCGIFLSSTSNYNQIAYCNISQNNYGIEFDPVTTWSPCHYNLIHHNNFINNNQSSYDPYTNYWDYSGEGNYWSDYNGSDANDDGIGDTPYSILGGTNQDNYSLMLPWPWPVHNIGKDTYYTTIQRAIDDADIGDTIEVSSGTYYENVIINKTITLTSEDRNNTIIDGGQSIEGDVIYINASSVNIDNFTIRNGWHNDCGVNICESLNNHITNCNILNNEWGIYLGESSNNLITNCAILNNERGIVLAISSNNTVSYCDIDSNNTSNSEGIILAYSANNNTITNCSIYNNICVGIHLEYTSNNNLISNCIISNTTQHGFYIYDSTSNFISNCDISYNTVNGMVLWQSSNNCITNCIISNNDNSGCYIFESANNNIIYHNNFINNTNNAYDECSNFWDNGIGEGNYWSDYIGIDNHSGPNQDQPSSDGIGDTPYNISGGTNQDRYPFMNPSGWEKVSGLTLHAPIYINGNSNFTSANGISSGNGTAGNPYIIENCDINASGADGIKIENTDKYFIIRNCVVHDGKNNEHYGIYFYNVIDGKIENVTSENNYDGIFLEHSLNNIISFCLIRNNLWYGLYLTSSSDNKIRNNTLANNEYNLGVYGGEISDYYQEMDALNTIDDKPIYYIVEQSNLVFDETMNIGYLSLISCKNITVKNLNLANNGQGLLIVNTSYSTIRDCTIYNCYYGIYIYSCPPNVNSSNCHIYNCYYGLWISSYQDTIRPQISNVQTISTTQAQGGYVNITCTVTDNFAVNTVKINITGPTGFTSVNITMTGIAGTDIYYYNTTYSIVGEYSYYIWANDASSNGNKSAEYRFAITIVARETIQNREINIIGVGNGTVNVTSVSPPQPPPENLRYITCINVTITGTLTYANITIKYNESDVVGIDEANLKMYYWNETEGKWKICEETGVDIVNKIVWANVTHLTIFAPMAEKIAEEKAASVSLLPYIIIFALAIVLIGAGIGVKRIKKQKPANVKCPKCGETFQAPSTERPLSVVCPKCGTKGTLK